MEAEMALRYFGIDWMAMALTFVAIYLLGNRSRAGFATMMFGNGCWVAIGVLSGSLAMVIANVVFIVMNARGWHRWAPETPASS